MSFSTTLFKETDYQHARNFYNYRRTTNEANRNHLTNQPGTACSNRPPTSLVTYPNQ